MVGVGVPEQLQPHPPEEGKTDASGGDGAGQPTGCGVVVWRQVVCQQIKEGTTTCCCLSNTHKIR